MQMPTWLIELTARAGGNRWIVAIVLIVRATGCIDLGQRLLLRPAVRVLGVTFAAAVAAHYAATEVALFGYVGASRAAGVIVALGWFALPLASLPQPGGAPVDDNGDAAAALQRRTQRPPGTPAGARTGYRGAA